MGTLENKVAIVSGAAQGLGKSFAERLAKEGARVVAFDTQAAINSAFNGNKNIKPLIADVSKRLDVEKVIATAASLGGIHVVVNNAGKWKKTPVTSSWEQAVADWDEIMDTNFKGVMLLSRAAVPHIIKSGGGDIINISTYYVLPARSDGTNPPDTDLYAASKWALNGFTDAWAKSLAKHNIRVNGMCMGATDSPMLRGLFPDKQLPPDMAATVMSPDAIAGQMIDLMRDGRTGENIGAWVGHPIGLPPRKAAHLRMTD
ncbi:MAG: SDR family oxidoreductase [Gammaproteobacteria bacterium]|nr:SDR family oxidoreductase [Gammaproteobacteria bacterium]